MCDLFTPSVPATPSAGQITSENLQAQMQALQGTGPFAGIGSIGSVQPLATAAQLNAMNQFLNGVPGQPQTRSVQASQAGYYDAQGNYLGGGTAAPGTGDPGNWWIGRPPSPGAGTAGPPGSTWRNAGTQFTVDQGMGAPTPGLLATLTDKVQPVINQLNTSQRTANVGDVAALGPAASAATRAANPQTAGLLDQLGQQAAQQVALGTRLSPEQLAEVRNSTQGISSAHGWGYSPGDLARVGVETTDTGNQMQQVRQQFGQSVANQTQNFYGDPFSKVLSGSTGAAGASALAGQGTASNPAVNPLVGNAADITGMAYNAQAAASTAGANNQAGIVSSALSY